MNHLDVIAGFDLSSTIVAVDFDGTCVMHRFPEIGEEVPGAVDALRALADAGAKIILWTVRSDQRDAIGSPTDSEAADYLAMAVEWFHDRGIGLYGVNRNEQQQTWSSSPKAYAHIYIDDAALGCPVINGDEGRPYADWAAISKMLFDELINGGGNGR